MGWETMISCHSGSRLPLLNYPTLPRLPHLPISWFWARGRILEPFGAPPQHQSSQSVVNLLRTAVTPEVSFTRVLPLTSDLCGAFGVWGMII
jgi:hypothetical protein